jgi:hypothetical protein
MLRMTALVLLVLCMVFRASVNLILLFLATNRLESMSRHGRYVTQYPISTHKKPYTTVTRTKTPSAPANQQIRG